MKGNNKLVRELETAMKQKHFNMVVFKNILKGIVDLGIVHKMNLIDKEEFVEIQDKFFDEYFASIVDKSIFNKHTDVSYIEQKAKALRIALGEEICNIITHIDVILFDVMYIATMYKEDGYIFCDKNMSRTFAFLNKWKCRYL